MGHIDCPFLAHMFSAFQDTSNLYMVLEFVRGGDLMFHLTNFKRFHKSWWVVLWCRLCYGSTRVADEMVWLAE